MKSIERKTIFLDLLILSFCVVIFVIDVLLPLGVATGTLYVAPVLICLWSSRRSHFTFAAGCSVLTVLGYYLSQEGGIPWMALVNRGFSLIAIWVVAIIADQRRRYEAVLNARDTEIRAILETTEEGVITIDRGGLISSFNRAAEQIFGYPSEEVLGRNVSMLMPEPFGKEHDGYLRRYLQTGERRVIGIGRELDGLRRDGTIFPIQLAISELKLGERILFMGLVRDISDQRRADEAREKTQRIAISRERLALMGELAAGVAHEFRNPLHGVLNCIQLLRSQVGADPSSTELLDLSDEGLRRMDLISQRLLALARDERGPRRPTEIASLIDGALAFVRARAAKDGVELKVEIEPGLNEVMIEAERISEVLLNLLNNSLDGCSGGGTIVVSAAMLKDRKGYFELAVADNGSGIPAGIKHKVFDAFFTTKAAGKGSGLGLALAKKIADQHEGNIELESIEGSGTRVSLVLPVDE